MTSDGIVLTWLNDDLHLTPKVTNIRLEFSNGYRFGEVLYQLKVISENKLKQLKNSKKYEDQIENFKTIKKYLTEIFELEIRFEEFEDIMNLDVSKAVVVLYKIKNSYYKKLIHFNTINVFLEKPTQEEIQKKLKEIMDSEQIEEMTNYPIKLTKNKKKLIEEDTQFQKSYHDSKKKLNSIKSESNDSNEEEELINTQTNNSQNFYNDENDVKKLEKNLNTVNNDNNKKSSQKKLLELPLITKNNNNQMRKKYLKPISSSLNIDNGNKNLLTISNLNNKISISNNFIGSYTNRNTNFKYSNTINNRYKYNKFEESIFSEQPKDFYNDVGMTKIKEDLKQRLDKKKNENLKKQEELKKQYRIKNNVIEIKEIHQLDFVNKINNPLYKTRLNTNFKFEIYDQNKTKSASKRLEFSKNYKNMCNINKINKTRNYFKGLVEQTTDLINQNLLNNKNKFSAEFTNSIYYPQKNDFNKLKYFKHLNKYIYKDFNEYIKNKQKIYMNDFPLIQHMIYLIIDIGMDMYFYREENEIELLDLPEFKKFSLLFINNKTTKMVEEERYAKLLAEDIDKKNEKDNKKIDIDNLELTNDDIYLIEDYINYIGIWNDEKIINKELLGYKFEYKNINKDLPLDYEPTKTEIEDLVLPKKNIDDFLFGNTILDIIESKFSENKKYQQEKNEKINKWGYIPYKLSLIGYPFSGRKFISNNLCKKYPNIKIYSIEKIVRNYYIEYRNIIDAIEGKNQNNLKPNQLEQLKTENTKKLEEYKPIIDLIQPYIDEINKEREKKTQIKKQEIRNDEKKPTVKNVEKKPTTKQITKAKNLKPENSTNEIVFSINDDLKILPNDEVLFSVLKYKIESDFPIKSKEDSEKEIIDYQTKIFNILSQIETIKKQKQENSKQNPKNDTQIINLEKELENLKTESIKGFILVDYPTNINQCNLLENYLTGYIDETQKPKSEKNLMISKINTLIDFKLKPKENVTIKRAGIDFIINLVCQEKDINSRYQTKKYDPINDIIYTSSDLSDENKNKTPIDKKILERLVNDVPYLTEEIFQKLKEEYNDNISLINKLYNKFGILVNISNVDEERNLLGIDFNEKETKKCFQSIIMANAEDILLDRKKKETDNNLNNDNNTKEDDSNKRKEIKKKTEKKPNLTSNKNLAVNEFEIEEFNKNKIINFISQDIIGILYKENDKNDKIIFYSKHPEYNVNEENDRIRFAPEFENSNNEIVKKNNNFATMPVGDMRLLAINIENNNNIVKDLIAFNEKYYKELGKFIYLIKAQKNDIYERFTLIQLKFRDFLNKKTKKKCIINLYTEKYNEFFSENKEYFKSSKAINEFQKDLEELNDNLWLLINEKEKMSVRELDANKESGFIEKEIEKFYANIQNLFLLETEKFLTIFKSIIYLYSNKKEINLSIFKKENILENLYDINYENIKNESKDHSKFRITHKMDETDTSMKDTQSNFVLDNIILRINKNLDIILSNSIKLIFQYQEIVDIILKNIRDSMIVVRKKSNKSRRRKASNTLNESSSSLLSSFLNPKDANSCVQEEIFSKMIQNEKGKYKYRIMFLKSYASKYIKIIYQTAMNIYNNMDSWIVKNISLQNDALNNVIGVIKNCLENKILIDKQNDIDPIEMDDFEKSIGDNIVKPIDNNSVVTVAQRIYNKINIDYLINDKFNNINVDDLKNKYNNIEINPDKKVNNINNKNEKKLKLMESNKDILEKSINSSGNYSSHNIFEKNKYTESDFYYDINKFNNIYKSLKKYETEENMISQDTLYNIFIKQYLINKYEDTENEIKRVTENTSQKRNSYFRKKSKRLTNNKNNLEPSNEEKSDINVINHINNMLSNDNQNTPISLPEIPVILKTLNTKQINKLLYLCQINANENNSNDEKVEYEKYVNTNEVFTLLSLIGCQVLSKDEEEKILSGLGEKLKNERLLSKKDFMEFEFWFEQELVYQKEDVIYQQMIDENKNEEDNKNNRMNIKEFLFNLWKDDNGENVDFKQFLNVLKISKYVTDLNEFDDEKYFDAIFNINNK